MANSLEVEQVRQVRWLWLNRPERKNALDHELVVELTKAVIAANESPDTRVIIISGRGSAFCSGADLAQIKQSASQAPGERLAEFHGLILAIAHASKPVIAGLPGPAAGFGADLAFACDLRIATEEAFVQESFIHIGLMPDGGSTFFLPELLGPERAFAMMALGERVTASALIEMGLVHRVVPSREFTHAVQAVGDTLSSRAPLALGQIKKSIRRGQLERLESALASEREGQLALLQTEDFSEGVQAFLEKRAPNFQGH